MNTEQNYVVQEKQFKKLDEDFGFYEYETRFIICQPDGTLIDDAQGYGYKTAQAAHKAHWFKNKGGKEKIDLTKKQANVFWKKNKKFGDELRDYLESNWKREIPNKEIEEYAKEKNIIGFSPKFLEYLFRY
ncbi:hypothetical protein [Silvanigrella sp.]|jgi:hypothetical protein|uniref:hypothetical protein n=1 Tax=Silvanigrella sp. TaxID=2024976 RepID=UPI0037C7C467